MGSPSILLQHRALRDEKVASSMRAEATAGGKAGDGDGVATKEEFVIKGVAKADGDILRGEGAVSEIGKIGVIAEKTSAHDVDVRWLK